MKAWHFVRDTLRNGDPVPADGELLRHDGPLEMCVSGLHASKRLIDALQYAPGNTICRVEVSNCEHDIDKLVCRERTIIWRVDGKELLHDFARRCALGVIDKWDPPDVVREYLTTGNESLRASARDSAWASLRDSAWASQNRRLTAMVAGER